MRHLRAFVFDDKIMSDWVKYLTLVQQIINNKKHESTQVSPASIITPGIDLDNALVPASVNSTSIDTTEYIKTLVEQQNLAIVIAR